MMAGVSVEEVAAKQEYLVNQMTVSYDRSQISLSSSVIGPIPPQEPKPTSPQHQAGDRHEQDLCRRHTGVPLPTEQERGVPSGQDVDDSAHRSDEDERRPEKER
jgi:hypothetical protein